MPYYKITIRDKSGKVMQGIRYDSISAIDVFYGKARQKAITTLKSEFDCIDVVMLSSFSLELQEYKQSGNIGDKTFRVEQPKTNLKKKDKFNATNSISFADRVSKLAKPNE